MEMEVCFGREREVEGLVGIKVWNGFGLPTNPSENAIMVVETSAESMYRRRRSRLVPKSISVEIRKWRQSEILGGCVDW